MFTNNYYEPCMDTILDVNMIQDIANYMVYINERITI